MKRLHLIFLSCLFPLCLLWGQPNEKKEKSYQKRKLRIDEINIIGSLYNQDGNHSSVTGGIGTEKLMDISSQFEVKLLYPTEQGNNHRFNINLGIDYYTSASSDNIEYYPFPTTSASYSDKRIYPSFNYSFQNIAKEFLIGGGLYFSKEFDYTSIGVNALFAKEFNKKNSSYQVGINLFLDELLYILPFELRTGDHKYSYPTRQRNTFSLSQTLSQILTPRTSIAVIVDFVYQEGFLGTPFNRVISSQNTIAENLPSTRYKLPLGFRINHFINSSNILRGFYRFYIDNWGIIANTAEVEWAKELSQSFNLIPSLRVYQQTGSTYFLPYNAYTDQLLATSDYDLSSFVSIMPGLSLKFKAPKPLFFSFFGSAELKYSYYYRSDNLAAHILTLALQLK